MADDLENKYTRRAEMQILDTLGLAETEDGKMIPAPHKAMTKPVIQKTPQGVDVQLGLVGSNKPLVNEGLPEPTGFAEDVQGFIETPPPTVEPRQDRNLAQRSMDLVEQVTVGAGSDALVNMLNLSVEGGEAMRSMEIGEGKTVQDALSALGIGGKVYIDVPRLERSGDNGVAMLRGMSSFLMGMGALKVLTKAGPLATGAGADFSFVDREQNISDLFNQLAPELRNPVTDFLSNKTKESEFRKALNNTLEGMGLGVMAEAMFTTVRQLKNGGFKTLQGEEGAIQFGPGGFDDSIKGKKVFPDEPFTDSAGAAKEPKKQMFMIKGRQMDLGRFSINWDLVNKPDDIKQVMMVFRKEFKKALLKSLPEKRTLDAVVLDSLERLEKSTDDEFVKFLTRNAKEGFTDVDLAIAKWFRNESASELAVVTDQFIAGVPGYRKRFAEHLTMHSEVERIHQTMQAFSSNLLNANNAILDMELGQGKELFANHVGDLVGGISPTDDLMAIALRLKTFKSPVQLETMMRNLKKPNFNDMLEEAYVAGLLSSIKTHMVNIVSNKLVLLNHFGPERFFRAGVGAITRSPDRVRFGEISEAMFGLSEAVKESWIIAKNTFATGKPSAPGVKVEGRLDQAISAENVDALLKRIHAGKHPMRFFVGEGVEKSGAVGKAFDGMGMFFSIPFKGLMSMDDFFKTMAYRLEVNAMAYRKAVNSGKTGNELAEEIVRLKTEIPKDIQIDAAAAGRYVTFTEKLGPKGQSIQDAVKTWGLPARYVIPFIRTPMNIFKYNLERTPALNMFIKESREPLLDMMFQGKRTEAADTAMARLMMGGLVAYSVVELSDMGMITGSAGDFEAVTDRNLRATDLRAGWRANSILLSSPGFLKDNGLDFDEFYISYDRGGDAFGMIMGMAADFRKLSLTAPDDVTEKAFAVIAISLRNQLLNKTWMYNFREFMEAVNFTDESADLRKLSRTVIPRIVANLRTEVDPAMREARTILDQMKKDVPFFSEDLALRLNAWGDWIPADPSLGWDFISPFTVAKKSKDPVALEMQEQRIGLPEIQKIFELDGARIELTPEQMNRWKIIAGKELMRDGRNLKETIGALIQDERYKEATNGPGGGKEALVQSIYRAFRDAAKAKLLEEDDALRGKWKKEVKKRVERLTGQEVP